MAAVAWLATSLGLLQYDIIVLDAERTFSQDLCYVSVLKKKRVYISLCWLNRFGYHVILSCSN